MYTKIKNIMKMCSIFRLKPIKVANRNFGTKLPNGSYDGLLGLLERNESQILPRSNVDKANFQILHYTLPLWKVR